MRVLICGGGVVGAATAYFLSRLGVETVVIERHEVAGSASGKSGGFLARDWCDGSPLQSLARRSFDLHAELAAAYPDRWGYRRLETVAVLAGRGAPVGQARASGDKPAWLGPEATVVQRLGTEKTTAQVDPAAFTRGMMDLAIDQGARLIRTAVTGLTLSVDGRQVTGVTTEGGAIEGDAVLIALGPWSDLARTWVPLPAVYGLKGHSLILRNPGRMSAHAVFGECRGDDGRADTPEVFPRPDGTTYICGLSAENPLPADPADVTTTDAASERLRAMLGIMAPAFAEAEIIRAQACYRPVTRDGLPLMGPVAGTEGLYVSTGHSVWGMLNAPASGEAVARLIAGSDPGPVSLTPFHPIRMPATMTAS